MNKFIKLCLNIFSLSIIALSTFGMYAAFYAHKDLPKIQEVVVYEPAKNADLRWNEEDKVYEARNLEAVIDEKTFPNSKCLTSLCRQFEISWNYQADPENPNRSTVQFKGRNIIDGDKYDYEVNVIDQKQSYKTGLKPVFKTYKGKEILSQEQISKATKQGHLTRVINQNFLFIGQEKYYPYAYALIALIAIILSISFIMPYSGSKAKRLSYSFVTMLMVTGIVIFCGPVLIENYVPNGAFSSSKILILTTGLMLPAYLRAGLKKLK